MDKKLIIVAAGYDLPHFSAVRDLMIESGIGLGLRGISIPPWRPLPQGEFALTEEETQSSLVVFTVGENESASRELFDRAVGQLRQRCDEVWVVTPYIGDLPGNHWLCSVRVWAMVQMRESGGEAVQVLHSQGLIFRLNEMLRRTAKQDRNAAIART